MAGPLDGVNVLDFGQAGVGPWSASLLGFLGANVLKIERPEGDTIRSQQPTQRGLAVAYTVWNMSKKGATINLKDAAARPSIEPLIQQADVIVENLRPRVMTRLGLDFEAARQINPKIVYASSPGWGTAGPMASLPGVDADFQAFSGFASMSGDEGGKPEMARHLYHFDLTASVNLACSMVLGLIRRDRLGTAQQVGCSHLASTMSQLSSRGAEYLLAGNVPGTLGSASGTTAPHQAFMCLDRRWLAVGVENEDQWRGFCRAIRHEELLDDPRFATNRDRVAHRRELANLLTPIFAARPTSWWGPKLTRFGVPNGHFLDFEALRYHQQVVENGYMVEMDVPHQGPMAVGGIPWTFSTGEGRLYHGPAPGEHTEQAVTQGFGMFGPQVPRTPRHARPLGEVEPPLAGLRVIDATQGLAGPYAALLLADAGAEVIKVEPAGGDYARGFAPATASGSSAAFEALNRNKQSVTLDLETEEGRAAFRALARTADVIIEDWGVGRAGALGLDDATLRADNPGLVFCALSAFGERGPLAGRPGSELVLQAMTDYCQSLGEIGAPPVRWGSDLAGLATGGMACLGVLAALYQRHATGRGQRVALSPFGVLMLFREASWSVLGDVDEWSGPFVLAYTSPRLHGWQTRDKPVYFRLHRASEEEYLELLIDLGMEELLADDRFGNAGRDAVGNGKYAIEVAPIWEEYLGDKTSDEVIEAAVSHNAMCVAFNSIADALEHPQVQSLGIVMQATHPALGEVRVVGAPFRGAWEAPTPRGLTPASPDALLGAAAEGRAPAPSAGGGR